MLDQDKSKQELSEELAELRRRVAVLETADTNRKQVEAALRESEERYRLLSELVPHPVWRSDAEAQEALAEREARLLEAQEVASLGFYFWDIAADRWTSSPVLDRILGVPADYERTIDGWANLVHPDERQAMLDHLLKEVVGKKQPCDREYRIVRHGDKQIRWVHGLGRLQFNEDGRPVSMLGTIQDITGRKLAEEKVRQSEERLRRFYESGLLGVIYWTMNGQIIDANDKFLEIVGYERVDLVAGRIDWINMTPPEWRHLDDRSVEGAQGHGRQQGALRERVCSQGWSTSSYRRCRCHAG